MEADMLIDALRPLVAELVAEEVENVSAFGPAWALVRVLGSPGARLEVVS
jgi:hypothetical protein